MPKRSFGASSPASSPTPPPHHPLSEDHETGGAAGLLSAVMELQRHVERQRLRSARLVRAIVVSHRFALAEGSVAAERVSGTPTGPGRWAESIALRRG